MAELTKTVPEELTDTRLSKITPTIESFPPPINPKAGTLVKSLLMIRFVSAGVPVGE